MIRKRLLNLLAGNGAFKREIAENDGIFCRIIGYEGLKRTFLRSLSSTKPVHILLVGLPGQAKTMFLKCILEAFGEKKAYFTVGGTASKSGLIRRAF
jgi:holliday junction DNA helicase RuvB